MNKHAPELTNSLTQAVEQLEELRAQATATERPAMLPINKIAIREDVFQARLDVLSERHLSELERALKNATQLDPIVVVPITDHFVLIDGHHRFEAYTRAGRHEIPVTYFDGTIKQAVLESAVLNSLAKLPMTSEQRQNCAWKFVRAGIFSKAETARAASVGTSQVAIMRKAKAALGDDADDYDVWWQARRAYEALQKGAEYPEFTESDLEERAQRIADDIVKAISQSPANNSEIMARALQIYLGRNAEEVAKELIWLCGAGENMEGLEDDEY